MADPRGAGPVDNPHQAADQDPCGSGAEPTAESSGEPSHPCPECANPRQTLVSEGDVVAIYRCPTCGHLSAPVKER